MPGRHPANVILSSAMAEVLDEQSGISKSTASGKRGKRGGILRLDGFHTVDELRKAAEVGGKTPTGREARSALARYEAEEATVRGHDDEGGASRFFLTAGYEPWELEWIIANGLTPCGT